MRIRWSGVLILGLVMWSLSFGPTIAALSEGNFNPCISIGDIADSRQKLYRIQKGDTLWGVSRNYNVDLQVLMVVNHLNEKSVLSVGQLLKIPGVGAHTHIIGKGDTLWCIASRYNISTSELIRLNPTCQPDNLKIGDRILLPDNVSRIAAQQPSRGISISSILFSWPLTGIITSSYGWRKSGFHHGVDIAADTGTPIKACAAGTVIFAGTKPIYGRTVIIEHKDGKQSLYGHASKILVSDGQQVRKGEVIAKVGSTGNATGPHLHLEIKRDGKALNPLNFLQ